MSRHTSEYTTIRLSEELLRRARGKAAAAGHTLISPVEEGLRIVVAERTKRELVARSPPRISAAAGGLMSDYRMNFDRSASLASAPTCSRT